ncbi:ATP-dependent Clp protease ATP-binding subunit [Ruminococcaceae bacterium OttesenSCG-928-D13]|nr:ATP-dependent Clp protease ATP-binding subunit [Ruminococcaceae bacterium OttesenSCG-928-D13]
MMCTKCKKRPAIVFIQRMDGEGNHSDGYCLTCAHQLGIKPVDDMIKQFGISEGDLENMEERFAGFIGEGGIEALQPTEDSSLPAETGGEEGGEGDDDFVPGSSATFPFVFGGAAKDEAGERDGNRRSSAAGKKNQKRKFLDTYCDNLTQKAAEGRLDRIIGRDREIYRTIQILSRRQKNNPCLIGEAGVGKTAIAEGIALRIAQGEVPSRLKDKEIYLLDLTSLVAGTQFRGQFESRVKGLIGEVKAAGNVILFIDEVHNITGAGDSEGAMNAANILKPALSRGEIQVIGATTFSEYRKFIEKDQALERRFQPVKVEEPSIEDTIAVLGGVKEYYEEHHHVKVSDTIVEQCVNLSERYITDRFLPDKAIDLLDEACACCSLRHAEITRWQDAEQLLKELTEEETALEQKHEPDYQRVAEVKSEIARQQGALEILRAEVAKINVTMEDVARVIELWTGIPAVKIEESEYSKLANLEERLKEKVVGQDEAVHLVASAIKRSRADISGRRRPASFIFVGPTGVGKTELVKQLAFQLFDSVDPLIRLDMSEFMEKHAVSRLIGSPPGYVGYDEAGQLTEKVRRKPYSVVLFDEIEKAHPDVMNILLQILDEGKINDAQGRTVSFENTVICMTSNAGSGDRVANVGFDKTVSEISQEKSMKALKDFLRPEFLSRVDEIVAFKPLTPEDLDAIAALMLAEYKEPLVTKGISLTWNLEALSLLVEKAKGGKFGARDLRRVIRKEVEDRIAEGLIANSALQQVRVGAADGEIEVALD